MREASFQACTQELLYDALHGAEHSQAMVNAKKKHIKANAPLEQAEISRLSPRCYRTRGKSIKKGITKHSSSVSYSLWRTLLQAAR